MKFVAEGLRAIRFQAGANSTGSISVSSSASAFELLTAQRVHARFEPVHLLASANPWSLAQLRRLEGLEFRLLGQVPLERPRGHLAKTWLFTVLTEPWPVKFSRNTKINLREQGFCQ
jgi:hypothetical protein